MHNFYLSLWLEGPMQSWGHNSVFYRKDTLPFPTKSGVVGLLLSAMGRSGPQCDFLKSINTLDMAVDAYTGQSITKNQDFMTIGGGYDPDDPRQSLFIPKKGNGQKASAVGGVKLFYKAYLQNAKFAVVMELPSQYREEIVGALKEPVYEMFLGRKSYIPTEFIYQGDFDSKADAELALMKLAYQKQLKLSAKIYQGINPAGEALELMDVPLEMGEFKRYGTRIVSVAENADVK